MRGQEFHQVKRFQDYIYNYLFLQPSALHSTLISLLPRPVPSCSISSFAERRGTSQIEEQNGNLQSQQDAGK